MLDKGDIGRMLPNLDHGHYPWELWFTIIFLYKFNRTEKPKIVCHFILCHLQEKLNGYHAKLTLFLIQHGFEKLPTYNTAIKKSHFRKALDGMKLLPFLHRI